MAQKNDASTVERDARVDRSYFHIVFEVYLQFRGENIAHDENVVLLVIHRQSVHGVEMRKQRVTLSFDDVLQRRGQSYNDVQTPVPILLDGTRAEYRAFARRLLSQCT